ncbi:MaoC/PaaZ C-terminal domain-containing protein [Photobacterium sanctipauli]|nr:MaoC/PaaZ C-terminal domain-containing protein [Photobacterium sanctipauli]
MFKRGKIDPLPACSFRVTHLVFEDSKVSQYSKYCGFASEHSFVSENGDVPLSYLFVATQSAQLHLLTQPEVSLPLLGMVHVGVGFEQYAPILTRHAYEFELSVGEQLETDKGLEFELVGELYDGDELAASYRSRCLVRKAANQAKVESKRSEHAAPERQQIWVELASMTLTPKVARGYARVSGDYNPIHLHKLTALPFGFAAPIIHGMYSVARLMAAMEQPCRRASFSFVRPALLPCEVVIQKAGSEVQLVKRDGKVLVEGKIITEDKIVAGESLSNEGRASCRHERGTL